MAVRVVLGAGLITGLEAVSVPDFVPDSSILADSRRLRTLSGFVLDFTFLAGYRHLRTQSISALILFDVGWFLSCFLWAFNLSEDARLFLVLYNEGALAVAGFLIWFALSQFESCCVILEVVDDKGALAGSMIGIALA